VCSIDGQFLLFNLLPCGPQSNGSWLAPGLVPHNGTYTPNQSVPGTYLYVVTGTAPCSNDTAAVTVFENPAPSAGTPGSLQLCSDAGSVNLFTALGGTPDPNGTWVGPAPDNPPFSGSFVPGVSSPGTYTYTVNGAPPCPPQVSSTVSVSVGNPPNAGCSNSIVRCSNSPPFDMFLQLGCNPTPGGLWTGPLPGTQLVSNLFFPGITPPGTYKYSVPGTNGCGPAHALLTITVNQAVSAGTNATLAVCANGGIQALFPLLGPGATPGGTWTGPLGPHSGNFDPTIDPPGVYSYTVQGPPGCINVTAQITVTVNQPVNAGFNGLRFVCNTELPFELLTVLGGSPQPNGTWTNPLGNAHSGIFLPNSSLSGTYTYTVNGTAPCPSATAQATVIVNQQPHAGANGFSVICSDQTPFPLFPLLGGSPDNTGFWLDPTGGLFPGTFVPGSSTPGTYTYVTIADAPCVNDSAAVEIVQFIAPNAGISTVAQICSNSGPVDLITLLAGSPQPNGTWTFNGQPHGPLFNPAVDQSGSYVYTVPGQSPCSNATAQVVITKVAAANPGVGGGITACLDATVDLFSGLGGQWNPNGSWANLSGQGQLTGSFWNATGVPPGTYPFQYTVVGQPPCGDVSSTVNVTIVSALNAGEDASVAMCVSQVLVLFNELGGSPQPGGQWVNVDGANGFLPGGILSGQLAGPGTFRFDYVLPASSACDSDTARVTVTVQSGPFAGENGFTNMCSTVAPFNLFSFLNGAQPGGSWFTPSWAPHAGNGVFVVATDPPGPYHYVIPGVGSCPADTAQVTVQITQAPNAGNDASTAVCSNGAVVNLFPLLGPNAQAGGFWTAPGNVPHTGFYNPATNGPGIYTYTVPGQSPCANDFATVNVSEPQAPNAGTNWVITVCSSQGPITLVNQLPGSPDPGGSWTGPNGPHNGLFNPASDTPGGYTYTVAGTAPCSSASATLAIAVDQASNPGVSTTLNACVAQTSVDLFTALGTSAQPGGHWTDVNGSNALNGGLFNPSLAGIGTWNFIYGFPANGTCPAVSATVGVTVTAGANAGENGAVTVCGANTAFPLFNALGGNPQPGGTWTDLTGTGALTPNGILNANLLSEGTIAGFTYAINDPVCGTVSATVVVTVTGYPDPGADAAITLCSTSAPVVLFDVLGGDPEPGGAWTRPGGAAHNGIFIPGTDPAGVYNYTVAGNQACPDSSAQVTVTVNNPPNAGGDGFRQVCDTLAALDLLTVLAGSPQGGGVWTDLSASGALNGSILNTTGLPPGDYFFLYVVSAAGCTNDSANVKLTVVDGVEVLDVTTVCDPTYRTYTVSFVIAGGDPSTYTVAGLAGSISPAPPYRFTSAPLYTSQPYSAEVFDANGCNRVRLEGASPCTFDTDVFVPELFSPNDDGINDAFIIPGIEGFPGNSIVIFNRWGAKMFEANGYDNRSVVWDGTSPGGLYSGKAPSGTYYYILDLGNGKPALTGFIHLNR
jgi:gliding motility-associated-like protein